jgi:hypothetical protein
MLSRCRSSRVTYIRDLIAAVRSGEPHAASELADYLEHLAEDRPEILEANQAREWRALILQLDAGLEEGLSRRKRANIIRSKLNRYVPRPSDEGTQGERAILKRMADMGIADLGERTVRRILGGR